MKKLARKEILDIKPYVPGKPIDDVKREYGLDKVVKLASNENPLGPSKKAVEAMKEMLDTLHLYPDGYCYNIREKLAEKFDVKMENLVFGDGTDEVLEMLFLAYTTANDEVIFAHPSFVEYSRYSEIMGTNMVRVPLDENYRHDLEAIKNAVTDKTKMILICNPNNPTGTIVTKEEVDKFVDEISDDILIVFDEAYFEYAAKSEEYPNSLDYQKKGYKNVVTLRTFSKAYGLAGVRIGYAIADKEVTDILEKVRLPFNVTTLSQYAAIAALNDPEHIEKSIEVNEEGKKYLYAELDKLGLEYAETFANFIYIKVNRNGMEVFQDMLKKGVIVRAMPGDFIRVTVGLQEENEVFIEKLKEVL